MGNINLIEKLRSLGFKEYEARVFLVMLKGNPMSASEIAKEAKIIRNSIYDILKFFVEKGYCNEIETNTILNYQIINPKFILDKIERNYHNSFKTNISNLKDTFTELQSIYQAKPEIKNDKEINIELIRGFNANRVSKYLDIFKSSQYEILGMYTFNGVVSETLDETARKFIKDGGVIRSVYQANLSFKTIVNGKAVPASHDDLIRVCESFEKYGEQVRLSQTKIPNITIFDKQKIYININDKSLPAHKRADLIIDNPDFAIHMVDLFNFYWNSGLTVEEYKKINKT
jgi:sugar-specific transcriptional regulator TrmB